jgi:hypothetical protein
VLSHCDYESGSHRGSHRFPSGFQASHGFPGFLEVSHWFPIGTHDEVPVDERAVNRLVVVVLQASLLFIQSKRITMKKAACDIDITITVIVTTSPIGSQVSKRFPTGFPLEPTLRVQRMNVL